MKYLFPVLLLLIPAALIASYLHLSPILVFILSAAAVIPLAKYIGDATEQLSARTNPAIGGLLNATFGNAPELIIGIFALQAGLIDVVKATITGSLIGNLLLALGLSMFLGGRQRERQKFNATAAKAGGSMLLLATIGLVIPAFFLYTSGADSHIAETHLSYVVAVLLILAYLANLLFSLHTHKHLYKSEEEVLDPPRWSTLLCVGILFAATIAISFVSDTLVSAIQPLTLAFGWTEMFVGIVVVAVIGNIAEYLAAITAARKDRMDLTLAIVTGSATQMVTLIAPLFVIASLFLHQSMDLVFSTFELVTIIFSVLVVNAVIEDGESTWLEGIQLIIAYVIMAVAFYFHP